MTKLCGAKTRAGGTCKQPAMSNGRCRYHGGKSLIGPASGTFKTGRYSKMLPTRLAARYQEAANDPDLLAMREDIALIDSRLADILGRVDTGESGSLWKQAQAEFAVLDAAVKDSDAKALTASLKRMQAMLGRGVADYAAWDEIGDLLEQRRKLVESERKCLVEMQQVLSTGQAMVFVGTVMAVVQKNVPDRKQLSNIARELQDLLAHEGRGFAAQDIVVVDGQGLG